MPVKKQAVVTKKTKNTKANKKQQQKDSDDEFDRILAEAKQDEGSVVAGGSRKNHKGAQRGGGGQLPQVGWFCTNFRGVSETMVNFEILRWRVLNNTEKVGDEVLEYFSELERACQLTKSKRKLLAAGPTLNTSATSTATAGPEGRDAREESKKKPDPEPEFFLQARTMMVGIVVLMYRMYSLLLGGDKDGAESARSQLLELLATAVRSFGSTVVIPAAPTTAETAGTGEDEKKKEITTVKVLAMTGARHYYAVAAMLRFWMIKTKTVKEYAQWQNAVALAKESNSVYGQDNSPWNGADIVHACESCNDLLLQHCDYLKVSADHWEHYMEGSMLHTTKTIPDENGLDFVKEGDFFRHLGKDLLRIVMSVPEEVMNIVQIVQEHRAEKGEDGRKDDAVEEETDAQDEQ